MEDKSKHAFGALERVDESIANGTLDAFDILFVKDTNGNPYIGWIDKDGNKVILEDKAQVVVVEGEVMPETGESGKIYIHGENGYFWDGTKFVNLCKPTDVTALENQISNLGTQIEQKVDITTVQGMIEEYSENANAIIEF